MTAGDRVGAQGTGQFPMTQTQYDEQVRKGWINPPVPLPDHLPVLEVAEDPPGIVNRFIGWIMRIVAGREYGSR